MDMFCRDMLGEVQYKMDQWMKHFAEQMAGLNDHKYQVDQQNHARNMASPRTILRKVTQDQTSRAAHASGEVLGERRASLRYEQARKEVPPETRLNLDPDA